MYIYAVLLYCYSHIMICQEYFLMRIITSFRCTRWRHQIETFSTSLALCGVNSLIIGEFDVFFDLWLNIRFRKQSWGWWFEAPSGSLWRQRNEQKSIVSCARHSLMKTDENWDRLCASVGLYVAHRIWHSSTDCCYIDGLSYSNKRVCGSVLGTTSH